MGRALAVLAFLLLPAFAQRLQCDATDVRFDFSDPGPLTFVGSYPVANLAGYLHLFDVGNPLRFLPTGVVGGSQPHRVVCRVTTPRIGGGGGTQCGAGTTWCLRISSPTGSLPPPLVANTHLLVQVQVVSGNATSHAPSPTRIGNLPDNWGLASIARNTTATLWIWFYLELDPNASFPTLPAGGTLTLTYRLRND
ncbi:hypothetical protein [Thermus amyloliquefaciens]|uniref:hypothetical protein n=1 Tax=Thermus amyloliquefaciens TaxID=1449080 RepID=UPI00056FDAD3|nr:hypothetical protein [Thermus amyloliquefaciens]